MTFYGIPDRQFVSEQSKAKDLSKEQLALVKDEHVRMSLRLQQAFGLRREEALKIQPRWADRGEHLQLKASWTKGGRERTVPIRTTEQRTLLEEAKQLAGLGSLIPGGRKYIEQLRIYERHTANAGLIENARPAPCLCPATLPGAHRLALAPMRAGHAKAQLTEAQRRRPISRPA